MTNLLLMGVQGSAMIVAILVLRALLLDRLPKATFCALWVLVVARLLVPLFVANPLGLWGLASHLQPHRPGGGEKALGSEARPLLARPLPKTRVSPPVRLRRRAAYPPRRPFPHPSVFLRCPSPRSRLPTCPRSQP